MNKSIADIPPKSNFFLGFCTSFGLTVSCFVSVFSEDSPAGFKSRILDINICHKFYKIKLYLTEFIIIRFDTIYIVYIGF